MRYFLGVGFALSALSLWWMALHMTSSTPFALLAGPLFLSGLAQSMLLVPMIVGVLSTTPRALNGKVSPISTLCVQLGGSIASAASVAVFDRREAFHSAILSGAVTLRSIDLAGLSATARAARGGPHAGRSVVPALDGGSYDAG